MHLAAASSKQGHSSSLASGHLIDAFAALQARLRIEGQAGFGALEAAAEEPLAGDVLAWPGASADSSESPRSLGLKALRQGEVAAVVLAGGMATRFDGAVKSSVQVRPGESFLRLKLQSLLAAAEQVGCRLTIAIMTSSFTDAAVRQELRGLPLDARFRQHLGQLLVFQQSVSLRLQTSGELFLDEQGQPSPHAPGHGDMLAALRREGTAHALQGQGVRTLYVSNLDNLAAWLDPALLGLHLQHQVALTAEVVPHRPDDAGGAWLRLHGKPQIVEGFRVAPELRGSVRGPLNTNNLWLDLNALQNVPSLRWFAVEKRVHGRTALQFEQILSELSGLLPAQAIEVPRDGDDCRFVPMKTPQDLQAHAAQVLALLARRNAS